MALYLLVSGLFNRKVIGFSARAKKAANLVYKAFDSLKVKLDSITIFHTDRGNKLKNRLIDEVLESFNIKRSLSMKGCPYGNKVSEATFKPFKTEFANNYHFSDS